MAEQIKKIIIREGEKTHVFTGGDASQPEPDSVGSEEIKDDSVMEKDLHPSVREKLNALDDMDEVTEEELVDCWQEAMRTAGLDLGGDTQEAGAAEGEDTGGGADLDG